MKRIRKIARFREDSVPPPKVPKMRMECPRCGTENIITSTDKFPGFPYFLKCLKCGYHEK